jgi:hypothetical protein
MTIPKPRLDQGTGLVLGRRLSISYVAGVPLTQYQSKAQGE